MRAYYCDLCKKVIKPAELRVEADIKIDKRTVGLDMHSNCWYTFIQELSKLIGEDERLSAEKEQSVLHG